MILSVREKRRYNGVEHVVESEFGVVIYAGKRDNGFDRNDLRQAEWSVKGGPPQADRSRGGVSGSYRVAERVTAQDEAGGGSMDANFRYIFGVTNLPLTEQLSCGQFLRRATGIECFHLNRNPDLSV